LFGTGRLRIPDTKLSRNTGCVTPDAAHATRRAHAADAGGQEAGQASVFPEGCHERRHVLRADGSSRRINASATALVDIWKPQRRLPDRREHQLNGLVADSGCIQHD